VTVTAEEFASDVRALLESLAEQAARGRLPSYLWGRADVLALSREVRVRSGIRKGASDEANAASGQTYALAAARDGRGSETMPWHEAVAPPPLPDAMEVELQPFTSGDVRQVIRAWQLPAAAERELMGRANDPAVAAMARVTLLLVILCALASEQPTGSELPRGRPPDPGGGVFD
jgi:hypothetical protein